MQKHIVMLTHLTPYTVRLSAKTVADNFKNGVGLRVQFLNKSRMIFQA